MPIEPTNLTQLVNLWKKGDHAAGDALFAAVQSRLRRAANKRLHDHGGFHRMQATEVVNQAYLRMLQERKAVCLNRDEFIDIAIRLIDRTILDAMRYERAQQRDFRAEVADQELDGESASYDAEETLIGELELERLDRAFDELRAENQVAYTVLVRKIFEEETLRGISQDLKISEDAAGRKFVFAKAFLASRLAELRKPVHA